LAHLPWYKQKSRPLDISRDDFDRGTTLIAGNIHADHLDPLTPVLRSSLLLVQEAFSQMRFFDSGAAGLPLCSSSLMDIIEYSFVH
jgi:hypothetical protein